MKNTLQLKKQLRARRRKQSKRQTLSLEQLEPKQLLSANTVDFDITIKPFSGNAIEAEASYSYGAPWTFSSTVQGSGNAENWTAKQSSSTGVGLPVTDQIITSIDDYYKHLEARTVAEVSDDLLLCFYQPNNQVPQNLNATPANISTLYPGKMIENAWVGSSDNLYSLLVLNQRFPPLLGPGGTPHSLPLRGGNGNLYGASDSGSTTYFDNELNPAPPLSSVVSDKALQGLTRIVGFAFGGGSGPFPNPIASNGGAPALAIFNRTTGPFNAAKDGSPIASPLIDHVPTIHTFFDQTNNGRPTLNGDLVDPLPSAVRRVLENWYADGFTNNESPIDIFSEMSGIVGLESLFLSGQFQIPYDTYTNTNLPGPFLPNFTVYTEACSAVYGYYNTSNVSNQEAINLFFENFVQQRTTQLSSLDYATDAASYDQIIKDLAIGLRALMAMSYDASPLWTSYGIGYANAANPMVGKTYDAIRNSSNFIELFSGQEFQPRNIQVPPSWLNVTAQEPSNDDLEYPTDGWFDFEGTSSPTSGIYYIDDVPDNSFKGSANNYSVTSAGTAIIFPGNSVSSETLTAASISQANPQETLTRDSSITVGSTITTLGELTGVVHHEHVLPASFATYISLGGGVDLVTGSNFDDVIIGATQDVTEFGLEPFHGRLTVNAGAGKDVVAPGRGGSLIQLGSDADKVVFGRGDLFGEANLLDFKFHEGDRIYIDSDIRHSSSGDTLTLTDSKTGAQKIVRLTGSSDKHWHRHAVHRIKHSTSVPSTTAIDPSALSAYPISSSFGSAAKGEFNYLETHSFDVPDAFTLLGKTLIIKPSGGDYDVLNGTVTSNAYKLPATLQLQIGNQWQTVSSTDGTSTADVDNKHQSYKTRSYEIDLSKVVKDSHEVATWDLATWFHTLGNNSSELAYQISITPFDDPSDNDNRWQPGNRQAQVFIARPDQSGPQDKYVPIESDGPHPNPWIHSIKTDQLPIIPSPADPEFKWSPHTEWKKFPSSQSGKTLIAYCGGLARVLLENNLHAKTTLPTELKPLQITVNGDFEVGLGTGAYNLSSRMMLWEVSTSDADTILAFQNQYENQATLSPLLDFDGQIHSLVTDQPVHVNGNGRISGWNIINNYPASARTGNDPFYWINSDLLAVSSVHQTPMINTVDDFAVKVQGITVAWPARRGDASVFIQDWNNPVGELQTDTPGPGRGSILINDQNVIDFSPATSDPRFNYQSSKAKVYDFKQIGGWADQTDGPKVAAYQSVITNSFIHANDDSIKVQAPGVVFNDMTVLQGNAGNAVGYAYGFVNGGVTDSVVDSVWVHRITNHADNAPYVANSGNPYGLVAMRIVPSPEYFYDNNLVKNAATGISTGKGYLSTEVKDVYVPQLKDNKSGTEFNSLSYAAGIVIADTVRGFGATVPDIAKNFDFPIGTIKMYDNWEIQVPLTPISTGDSYAKAYGSNPSWFNIGSDIYSYVSNNSWTQVSTEIKKPSSTGDSTLVYLPKPDSTNYEWAITLDLNEPNRPHSKSYKATITPFLSQSDGTQISQNLIAQLYGKNSSERQITRPVLHRSSKIIINRQNGLMGPDPIKFSYSSLADTSLIATSDTATAITYVVSNVDSGYVEKKRSDGSWVDVSTPITTSNPRALIQLLRNRMIAPGDEVRWVPGTANEGKASAQAFSLYGWDGVSASVEASEIEVGVE